ncbi:hypothetical protein [Gordonia neofelifaecis]|uniref:Uncharacterized protein n=1 Tax=Gordonia neofelifaecis NRRL B-59395 TaxID=644548 RepID=F1YJP8_9ACTN|nr:hypothetical protein [Gordonia neofelifaecis]EGD54980.1 hypothetical protein SCNU_10631 [Gordonia neofelifaecis NRRL B-59395]
MTIWRHADWSIEAEFGDDAILYSRYPHPAASVRRSPRLASSQVRDVDSAEFPPQIRTTSGETLFVPREGRFGLAEFAARNRVPEVRRPDLWSLVLEPFLDTEVTAHQIERVDGILRTHGLTDVEIGDLRGRVSAMMESYNAFLWDWTDLNLYDLVCASSVWHRSDIDVGVAFYRWAMEIADRPTGRSLPSAP